MIVLNVIQENNQEEICLYCERVILECKRSTSTFQCEGRYCDDANEMFYETYPEKASELPEFIYKPSMDIILQEKNLDLKISALALKMSTDFIKMRIEHTKIKYENL